MNDLTPEDNKDVDQGTQIGEKALQITQDALDRFLAAAHVDAVYGQAVTHNETLVIPASEVTAYLGLWLGGNVSANGKNAAGGSGGLGKVKSRPVNVITANARCVRVRPAVDVTKIVQAALATIGFIAASGILISRKKSVK